MHKKDLDFLEELWSDKPGVEEYDEYFSEASGSDFGSGRGKQDVLEIGTDESRTRYQSVTPNQPVESYPIYTQDMYSFNVIGGSAESVLQKVAQSLGVDADHLDAYAVKQFMDNFKNDPQNNSFSNRPRDYDNLKTSGLHKEDVDLNYYLMIESESPHEIFDELCEKLELNPRYIIESRKKMFIDSLEFHKAGDIITFPFANTLLCNLNETNNIDTHIVPIFPEIISNNPITSAVVAGGTLAAANLAYVLSAGRERAHPSSMGGDIASIGAKIDKKISNIAFGLGNKARKFRGYGVNAAQRIQPWATVTGDKYKYFDEFANTYIRFYEIKEALHKINEGNAIVDMHSALEEYRKANPYSVNKNANEFCLALIKINNQIYRKIIDILRDPTMSGAKLYKHAFGPHTNVQDYLHAGELVSDAWMVVANTTKQYNLIRQHKTEFDKMIKIIEDLASDTDTGSHARLSMPFMLTPSPANIPYERPIVPHQDFSFNHTKKQRMPYFAAPNARTNQGRDSGGKFTRKYPMNTDTPSLLNTLIRK